MRDRWAARLRWLSAATLTALLAAQILRTGPIRFEAPRTTVSRTQPAIEPYLLFLTEVSLRAPEGATISILEGGERDPLPLSRLAYYLALGQLSRQRVLPAASLDPAGITAEYLGIYGGALAHPRFLPVASLERGNLYRRIE